MDERGNRGVEKNVEGERQKESAAEEYRCGSVLHTSVVHKIYPDRKLMIKLSEC